MGNEEERRNFKKRKEKIPARIIPTGIFMKADLQEWNRQT